MPVLIWGAAWAVLVTGLLARVLRQFRSYRQAAVAAANASDALPSVSVIVPVRNEIANIERCLAGLSGQTGLSAGSAIIVVDDGSEDGGPAAARRCAVGDPRIRLIEAGPLPDGWAGKPHACWRGAALAEGKWLCFVDADVRAAPGLVAAALATAEAQQIDMLSLQPRQEFGSFWERVVIPAGLLVLACAKRFEAGSHDVVNGQFLLIRREAYFHVGGHAAVRAEICEDKALALRIREGGFALRVLAAENLASTRMYRGLGSLWEGFSKNATEILDSIGATLVAAACACIFGWAALALPAACLTAALREPSSAADVGFGLSVVGTGIVVGIHCATARHFRVPALFGLAFGLGYTAVACLASSSVIAQLRGRVRWKGRTYRVTKSSPGGA